MILRSLCTDFQHNFHFSLSPDRKSVKTAFLRHYGSGCGAEKSKRIKKRLLCVLRSLCTNFQHNYDFFLFPDKKSVKTALVAAHINQKGINKGSPYFERVCLPIFDKIYHFLLFPNRKSVKNGVLAPFQRRQRRYKF